MFRLALRQTEGLIGSVIRLLGLDLAIPDQHRLRAEERDLDARRRALHEQRRHEEENGFYGR